MSLVKKIKKERRFLEGKVFFCLDMELSDNEVVCLRNCKIDKELKQFDHYGPIDAQLESLLIQYLSEMGGNASKDIHCVAQLITRLAHSTVEGFEKEVAWVMVRISLPSEKFNIPRWHSDGSYFRLSDKDEKVYKIVATLRGPKTLFAEKRNAKRFDELSQQSSKNFIKNVIEKEDLQNFKTEDMRIRKELVQTVKQIYLEREGQAVVYLVGDKDGMVHSEPKIDSPRIFVSILPGSKAQIDEWRGRHR